MGALGMGKGRAGAGGLAPILAACILLTVRALFFLILIIAMALLPCHMLKSVTAHHLHAQNTQGKLPFRSPQCS